MRKYQKHIGVDVSKNHLDIAEYQSESDTMRYLTRIDNTPEAIEAWLSSAEYDFKETVVCMEHTGIYINFLVAGLAQHNIATWVQNALHIKRSIGIQKGKNDKIDAKRIAKYAYRCEDECHAHHRHVAYFENLVSHTSQNQNDACTTHSSFGGNQNICARNASTA